MFIFTFEDDNEIEHNWEVDYVFHRGYRGASDGKHGPPLEPDEPATIEITQVIDQKTGEEIDDSLIEKYRDDLEGQAWEDLRDIDEAAEES